MTGRPHAERLLGDLNEIREELAGEVQRIRPDEWDWAPGPDMKSFRTLLEEIAAMEKICVRWLIDRAVLGWEEAQNAVKWTGVGPQAALDALGRVREATLGYLHAASEEQLQTPLPTPGEWRQYWGAAIEPEEVLRWVARHEYYHLGQIITYRWIRGDNPYKRS